LYLFNCSGWFTESHVIATWQTSTSTPTGTYRFVVNGSRKWQNGYYEYSKPGTPFNII
jgi:hypothetical protein